MARIKPKNSIKTKEAAIAAMARLNQIDTQLALWDMNEAEDIALVREKHHATQKKEGRIGYEAEKALLLKELESWAEEASATWPKRTMDTPFGKLGYRKTTPAVKVIKRMVKSFAEAVDLTMLHFPQFVRKVFEIDKEAILAADREGEITSEELTRCGLMVDQRDEFWIETTASKDIEAAAKKLKCA